MLLQAALTPFVRHGGSRCRSGALATSDAGTETPLRRRAALIAGVLSLHSKLGCRTWCGLSTKFGLVCLEKQAEPEKRFDKGKAGGEAGRTERHTLLGLWLG